MLRLAELPISKDQPGAVLTLEKTGSTISFSVYEYGMGESTIYLSRDQLFELLSAIEEHLLETADGE